MTIRLWNPLFDMQSINNLLEDRFAQSTAWNVGSQPKYARPIPIDVEETDNEMVVKALVPGIEPNQLHVSIFDSVLTIRGDSHTNETQSDKRILLKEHRLGSFERKLRLPDTLDFEKAYTEYQYGTLAIAFPKIRKHEPLELPIAVK